MAVSIVIIPCQSCLMLIMINLHWTHDIHRSGGFPPPKGASHRVLSEGSLWRLLTSRLRDGPSPVSSFRAGRDRGSAAFPQKGGEEAQWRDLRWEIWDVQLRNDCGTYAWFYGSAREKQRSKNMVQVVLLDLFFSVKYLENLFFRVVTCSSSHCSIHLCTGFLQVSKPRLMCVGTGVHP